MGDSRQSEAIALGILIPVLFLVAGIAGRFVWMRYFSNGHGYSLTSLSEEEQAQANHREQMMVLDESSHNPLNSDMELHDFEFDPDIPFGFGEHLEEEGLDEGDLDFRFSVGDLERLDVLERIRKNLVAFDEEEKVEGGGGGEEEVLNGNEHADKDKDKMNGDLPHSESDEFQDFQDFQEAGAEAGANGENGDVDVEVVAVDVGEEGAVEVAEGGDYDDTFEEEEAV